ELLAQEVHVSGKDDELDAARLQPLREGDVALLPALVVGGGEDGGLDTGCLGALERTHARLVRGDGDDRQARVEQRLEVRPLAAHEDADHAILPITSSPGSASGTTAQKPIPRLKTRRSSSSSTWRASQAKTGGRSHESQSISALRPAGRTRSRLPRIPPPVTCANARARPRRLRAASR